jgi:outer membrane protein TolC
MRHLWLAAAAAIALTTGAHAAPLTFDAALKLADQSAPSLQAKASDVRAARSSAIAAGRLPDPKVAVGVEGFPISGPNAWRPERDDFSDVRVGIVQDMPNGAKRQAARDRASADIGAAEAGGKVEARTVRLSTALAWIDLYYAERRLAALDDVEHALKPLRAAAPAQLASGGSRPAQTLQADQLTAELGDRRADLVAVVGKARAALARWTGDPDVEVAGEPPTYDVDPVKLRTGLEDVPSLRAYDAMRRQAEADVSAAKADKHPDWSWELGYQHRDPRFGDMVMVQATVSLPLFASTRQDPLIAARTETASRVRSEREAARRELVASLDADLADHLMHHDRLHRATATLVPLAQRRADLETASYAAGTASLADALGAAISLADARVDALDREADVARDGVRIVLTYEGDAQ